MKNCCECWEHSTKRTYKRSASKKEIADMQKALAAVAQDPNLTIASPSFSLCLCPCHSWNAHHIEEGPISLWDAETGERFN